MLYFQYKQKNLNYINYKLKLEFFISFNEFIAFYIINKKILKEALR